MRSVQFGPMPGALLLLFVYPGRCKFIYGMPGCEALLRAGSRFLNCYIDFRTVCCCIGHLVSPLSFVALSSTQIMRARSAAPIATEIRKALKVGPHDKTD